MSKSYVTRDLTYRLDCRGMSNIVRDEKANRMREGMRIKGVPHMTTQQEVEGMLGFLQHVGRNDVAKRAKDMRKQGKTTEEIEEYLYKSKLDLTLQTLTPIQVLTYCINRHLVDENWDKAAQIADRLAAYTTSKAPTMVAAQIESNSVDSSMIDSQLEQLTLELANLTGKTPD